LMMAAMKKNVIDTIHYFDAVTDKWAKMSVKLNISRSRAAAVLLPDEVAERINC